MSDEAESRGVGIHEKLRAAQAHVAARRDELTEALRRRDELMVHAVDTKRVGYRELARLLEMPLGNVHRILTDAGAYQKEGWRPG